MKKEKKMFNSLYNFLQNETVVEVTLKTNFYFDDFTKCECCFFFLYRVLAIHGTFKMK